MQCMPSLRMKRISPFAVLLALAGLWLAGLLFIPAARQDRVFGGDLFGDYRMPRTCASAPNTYRPDGLDRAHACYPAVAYLIARAFPEDVKVGGTIFMIVGLVALIVTLVILAGELGSGWLAVAALVASSPMLFAAYASNQILLAMSGVCLFFAWRGSDCAWRRGFAIGGLALAVALKIIPALFALVLVKERRWRDVFALGVSSAVLFLVPFVWCGGVKGFMDFIECLRLHADFFGIRDSWGFIGIDRSIRLGLGMGIESVRATYYLSRGANMAFALACLWGFWRTELWKGRGHSFVLLSIAVVMLPGGSVIYTALLLIPAMLVRYADGMGWVEALLWVAIFCPMQIPVGRGSANALLAAVAILGLGVVNLLGCRQSGADAAEVCHG